MGLRSTPRRLLQPISNKDAQRREHHHVRFPNGPFVVASDPNEIDYRRLLGLAEAGALLKSEIEHAFRIRARNAHPDSGGSQEDFQRLVAAKEALVRNWQR